MTVHQDGAAEQKLKSALPPEEWVELFPSGIAVENSLGRPVLILKDQTGNEVLPVWISPIDAGIALADLSKTTGLTPHIVTGKVLEAIGLKAEKCSFVDLIGHHQFVQLSFRPIAPNSKKRPLVIRLRADEAMSYCMASRARFFSTKAHMTRCRALDAELNQLGSGLADGTFQNLQSGLENDSKKHPYMM
jgi:hypothetical protein